MSGDFMRTATERKNATHSTVREDHNESGITFVHHHHHHHHRRIIHPSSSSVIIIMFLKVSKTGATTEIPAADIDSHTQGLEEHIPASTNTTTLGASKLDASHIHMQAALAKFETNDDDADADARQGTTKNRGPVMVQKSWRVNPDEFIIKVDASPLHQSAARRMFDPQARQKALAALEATKEEQEQEETTGTVEEAEPTEEHHVDWKDFWGKLNKVFFEGDGGGEDKK